MHILTKRDTHVLQKAKQSSDVEERHALCQEEEPDMIDEEALSALPAQHRNQGVQKQTKQKHLKQPSSNPHSEHADSQEEAEGVPATYNNMPAKHQSKHILPQTRPSAQPEASQSGNSQPASSAGAQRHTRVDQGRKKPHVRKAAGTALDYTADSESDDYMPTQVRAAVDRAAAKPAGKKAAALKANAKPHAKQPVLDKVPVQIDCATRLVQKFALIIAITPNARFS